MNPPRVSLPPGDADRLEQLLADRSVFGLDSADEAELVALLTGHGLADAADPAGYERTAAAVFLARAPVETEAMPSGLRDRVAARAAAFDFAAAGRGADTPRVEPLAAAPTIPVRGADWTTGIGLALAASLLLVVGVSVLRAPPAGDVVAARKVFVDEAEDAVTLAWADPAAASAADEPAAALGDVVWSDRRQQGFMRFTGLPANDPGVEQYQLWVFDAERDDRYPVDGGVFDVPATAAGEAVVPIDVKLPVTRATMFAVTIETPGGVVVSDRSRLPLLAQR